MRKMLFLISFFSLCVVNGIKPMKCREQYQGEDDRINIRTLDVDKDLNVYISHPYFCGTKTQDPTRPNYICASGTIKAGRPNGYNQTTRQPISAIELKVKLGISGKGLLRALFARSYEVYVWDATSKQMYAQKYIRAGCSLTFPDDFQKIGPQK